MKLTDPMTHHRYLALKILKRDPFAIIFSAPPAGDEYPEWAMDRLKTYAEWEALEDISR